jgi:signal transduction histidine kinase/ActR/RegA family two-component response regulator
VTDGTGTRAQGLALSLRTYVAGAEESARLEAYQAARDALAGGQGLLDVVADHQRALAMVLSGASTPEESARWVEASTELLAESLGPFEMAYRGFIEANEMLNRVNRDLEVQIEERKRAEEEARVAKEDADRANRAKDEFLSRMSHELRTPLNAVLGFAQLLEMDQVDPDQLDSVQQILKAGRHLLELINEVLEIARIESGRISLSLEPVGVSDALQNVMDLVRPIAEKRGVVLRSDAPPEPNPYVQADRQRLTQVLLNLLSNGVKYNREGGTVAVRCRESAHGRFRIEVQDQGRGIPPDKIGRLFNPFDRLDAEQTDVEGTGLGLALSKHLVEAMGGSVDVESEVDVGSTFSVELALTTSPDGLYDAAGQVPQLPEASPGKPTTVLYIEDNPSNLRLVERLLAQRPSVRLLSAIQGGIGLDLAREHRPDAILLDVHLPDIPGEEVLRRLREDPRTREIPVVVVTADATSGQRGKLLEAGARAYLTKPLDVKEFLGTVDGILSARSTEPK